MVFLYEKMTVLFLSNNAEFSTKDGRLRIEVCKQFLFHKFQPSGCFKETRKGKCLRGWEIKIKTILEKKILAL